jgi:hypothetical protein
MGIQLQVNVIDCLASIECLIKDDLSFANDYPTMFTSVNDKESEFHQPNFKQ